MQEEAKEPKPEITPSAMERAKRFLFHDLWVVDLASLSGPKGIVARLMRMAQLVVKGFKEDKLPIHASALTFSTLMAIVPVLAIALSLARGLGAGQAMVNRINEQVEAMPVAFRDYIQQNVTQVTTADFYAIGSIGLLILLAMAIQVLGSIESSFNIVWGIRTSRNLLRKVAYYISTLVVVPILILSAGTVTAFFEPLIARWGGAMTQAAILKLSPILAAWLGFAFLYGFMPNTRVKLRTAVVGGLVGAILWMGWFRFYIWAQPVGNYKFVYGAVASIPLFLMWLYISWVIVLLGAEFSFAYQNYSTFQLERAAPRANTRAKLLLGLAVISRAAESLESSRGLIEANEFAHERGVPIRLVNEILGVFSKAGFLAEVAHHDDCYVLLRAPERLKVRDILDVVMDDGTHPHELGLDNLREDIKQILVTMDRGVDRALENLTIRDILPLDAPM